MIEDKLRSEISDLEDEIQVLVTIGEELQEKLDECESPTFGMSISQVSCYEVLWKFYTHSLNLLTKLKKN